MKNSSCYESISSTNWDVVVIGAGAAGLMACLEIPSHLRVLLLNRNTSTRSSSRWAQGGIAAVTREEDTLQSHAEDTFMAGAGLCEKSAVNFFVDQAPRCVERLQQLGMQFDMNLDELSTTLEAAHSHRRVLHVQDQTGRALVEVLEDQVEQRINLIHCRGVRVTQLWTESDTCCGVQVLDGHSLYWISSRAVVLATGGGGHLFANTTNPPQSCGEGIALAWRAGADLEDLEFIQFHPTALHLEGAPCFLLSEALRGEGAVLVDSFGNSPLSNLEGGDLAPRDQVSRALVQAMHSQKVDHIGLDLSGITFSQIESRFPTILQRCREFGLDPLKELIPVAPAAHYWMGGVSTNLKASTSIKHLYAIGEVACTGLHGANRLASNSLMECLVFARQMSLLDLPRNSKLPINTSCFESNFCSIELTDSFNYKTLSKSIYNLRTLCWKYAGVNRKEKGMKEALGIIKRESRDLASQPLLTLLNNHQKHEVINFSDISRRDLNILLDLSNRQLTTILLLQSCLFRNESRGGHYRIDSPSSMPFWECHTMQNLQKGLFTKPVNQY